MLRFSKNIGIEVYYSNAQACIKVMYAINKFAPEKRIHLRICSENMDVWNNIPDDLIIFSVKIFGFDRGDVDLFLDYNL